MEGDFSVPTLTEELDFDSIVASSRFAFALKSGELWGCGANDCGQLGDGSTDSLTRFTKIPFAKRVKSVACGWEHSALLTEDGEVFVTGQGSKGQLGLGKDREKICEFTQVKLSQPIKQVYCGVWFTLVLTEDGQVLGWGSNRDRCLSNESISNFFSPIHVNFARDVIKIVAGHRHVIALKADGTIAAWGDNRYQQIPAYSKSVVDCFAGWHHSVLQISDSECLIFGKNDFNQLGHAYSSTKQNKLEFPYPIKSIAVGSDHTLVLLQNGELLSFGWNEHGVLGNETNETKHGEINKVKFDKEIKQIFCGYGSCFLLPKQ